MNNYNFFGGNGDPLLGGSNIDEMLKTLDATKAALEQRKQEFATMQEQRSKQPMQQPQSQTPVWDEIDKLTAELSDKEYELIASNPDFAESQQQIMNVLQAVQLRMMRPMVEGTPEGKKVLEEHLHLVKHLKKSASKEVDAELRDFREYQEHYSHLTWEQYKSQQKTGKGKKK